MIVCRADTEISQDVREKIAFSAMSSWRLWWRCRPRRPSTRCRCCSTTPIGDYIARHLGIDGRPTELTEWRSMVERIEAPQGEVRIALVGKYVDLRDSYMSISESLVHAGLAHDVKVDIEWVNSGDDHA